MTSLDWVSSSRARPFGLGKGFPMPFVLNSIYLSLLLFLSPWFAYRAARTGKYRERLGRKNSSARHRSDRRPALHLVSCGQRGRGSAAQACDQELARRRPGWDIVVSTTTHTGLCRRQAQTYPDLVTFYAPLDFQWATRRAMARVRPTVLALVELELWPNLVWAAKALGRQGGDRERPAQPSKSCGIPKAPGPARPDDPSARRRCGPEPRNMPTGSSISAFPDSGSA